MRLRNPKRFENQQILCNSHVTHMEENLTHLIFVAKTDLNQLKRPI